MADRARKPNPELAARMAALGAQTPATPAARKEVPVTTTEDPATASVKTPARRGRAMPVEQAKPATYSQRVNLTVTSEQKRALGQAALDDGIDNTYRIRAMISLWQEDERLRRRIDKRARDDQFRR